MYWRIRKENPSKKKRKEFKRREKKMLWQPLSDVNHNKRCSGISAERECHFFFVMAMTIVGIPLNSSGLWSMFPRKNVCWCSIFNVIIIIRFCLCSIAKSRQEVSSFLFIFILFFFCFFLLFREFSFSMGYDCVSRDNSQ
jgi:hypothetical protein